MGCQRHVFADRNCMACQVKDLKAQNVRQTRALEAATRVDPHEYYQAQAAAEVAEINAQFEMEAAAQARLDDAKYRRAMWEQTPDGQAWAQLSRTGEVWMAQAASHDEALYIEWRRAVEPRWFADEFHDAQRRAQSAIETPLFIFGWSLAGAGVAYLLNLVLHFTTLRVVKWGAFLLAIAMLVLWLRARKHKEQARPLSELQTKSDEVKAFVERYGANPHVDPENLPSWREGLTRGQNAAQIEAVRNWVYLPYNKFPAASTLPALPPLIAREDLSDWPESVAETLRARLEQN